MSLLSSYQLIYGVMFEMPGLLNATTNVTLADIEFVGNVSAGLPEFLIKVNNYIYDGWLFFILLVMIWVILFIAANRKLDQPLNNAMYSGAAVSVLSFLLRGVHLSVEGLNQGLLTDHQLWVFPILTMVIALTVWATKD